MRALGSAADFAAPASAEVVSSSPNGFAIRHSVQLVVPPTRAFAAIGELPRWWSKDHTYSGNAATSAWRCRPGGCFCETLEKGGGIEHLRVVDRPARRAGGDDRRARARCFTRASRA